MMRKNESASGSSNGKLFRTYIGATFKNVRFSDVPINPNVKFHFILAFAIDYTTTSPPSPTNGTFNIFWDRKNLRPADVLTIKQKHPNVKVALSLGGDTVQDSIPAEFKPVSVGSWVSNATSSLTSIIQEYHLDGIDINYEHFGVDPATFVECIGGLISNLKKDKVISFASIAPYDYVSTYYLPLWQNYGRLIDYVNFQFYAYPMDTTVDQFIGHFETQMSNYSGGKMLASFLSVGNGGLSPANGFFNACRKLKNQQKLGGIFNWCADNSLANGFHNEEEAQTLLANPI